MAHTGSGAESACGEELMRAATMLNGLHALGGVHADEITRSFSSPLVDLLNGEMAVANVERLAFERLQHELADSDQRLERLEQQRSKQQEVQRELDRRLHIKELIQQSAVIIEHIHRVNQFADIQAIRCVHQLIHLYHEHFRRGFDQLEKVVAQMKPAEEALASQEREFAELTKDDPTTVHQQGLLWKKGTTRRNWKQRWFVLKRGKLFYFDNGGVLKGIVSLVDVICTKVTHVHRDNCFQITSGAREFTAATDSARLRDQWIDRIRKCVVSSELAAQSPSDAAWMGLFADSTFGSPPSSPPLVLCGWSF
jgi:PH domain